jgi:hypothetical protein
MNNFIHTNDPDSAFELIKNNMENSVIPKLKVGYRKLDRKEYQVIWPENFQGGFDYLGITNRFHSDRLYRAVFHNFRFSKKFAINLLEV